MVLCCNGYYASVGGGGSTPKPMQYKGTWTPSAGNEYPPNDLTVGDMWVISGLTNDGYTFTSGNLNGQTIHNQAGLLDRDETNWDMIANIVFDVLPYFEYSQSLTEDSTTNTPNTGGTGQGWVHKLSLNIPANTLELGTYMVEVSYGWSSSSANRDFFARLLHNGTNVYNHAQEARDPGTDQKHQQRGRAIVVITNANISIANLFELEYASEGTNQTVWIRNAVLTIKRVI